MALKDRFNNIDIIEPHVDDAAYFASTQEVTLVEADLAPVFDELATSLSQKVASIPIWFEYSDEEQRKLISDFLVYKLENEYSDISFSNEEKEHIISLFLDSVHGFGALDYYISRDDIQAVYIDDKGQIFVNTGKSFSKEESVLSAQQFDELFSRISNQANFSEINLNQIRINKLVITLFGEPVCKRKILFEKLKADKIDFDLLRKDSSIDSEIYNFVSKLLSEKKNILIAGPHSSGKTAFLSAVVKELSNDYRAAVFEVYPILNSENCDKYLINGLRENELSNLVSAVNKLNYDYVVNDAEVLPVVLNDSFNSGGYIASVEADSLSQTVTKLSGYKVYNEKCTEKQAKAFLKSRFDYIFYLEKSLTDSMFKINSIVELSLNKTGSLVLTEILKYSQGDYWYNFSEDEAV